MFCCIMAIALLSVGLFSRIGRKSGRFIETTELVVEEKNVRRIGETQSGNLPTESCIIR